MQRSFYCHLVLTIGILAAIEVILQFGILKAILPMIIDAAVVLILIILIYHLNSAPHLTKSQKPLNQRQNQQISQWQKQHDQWWAAHQDK